MYAVRKVGTDELLAKGVKFGFEAATKPEDVWLFRRRQNAQYRVVNNMGRVQDYFDGGKWVYGFAPFSWVEQEQLKVAEVEIVLNVHN